LEITHEKTKTLAQKQQRAKTKRQNKRVERDQASKRKKKLRRIINVIDRGNLSGVESSPLLKANYGYVLNELSDMELGRGAMLQRSITS